MIPLTLDEIDADVIEQLIEDQVAESVDLDYKQALPGTDASKKRFLKCVTGLANTRGGALVLGVTEKRPSGHKSGLPGEVCGLTNTSGDEGIRRVTDLIRMGTDPALVGIEAKAIDGFPLGPVVVLRVRASRVGPHMVVFGGDYRFYGRSGASAHEMRAHDLRRASTLSASIPERLRDFRIRRLDLILDPSGPVGIGETACVVLHVVPLSSMDEAALVDLTSSEARAALGQLSPMHSSGWSRRFSIDGYLAYFGHRDEQLGFQSSCVQVLRQGAIEAVNTTMFDVRPNQVPTMRPMALETELVKAIGAHWKALRALVRPPRSGPAFADGREGRQLREHNGFASGDCFDRDDILIPDILLDEADPDVPALTRPAFDAMAQAAGAPASRSFDVDGRWLHYDQIQ